MRCRRRVMEYSQSSYYYINPLAAAFFSSIGLFECWGYMVPISTWIISRSEAKNPFDYSQLTTAAAHHLIVQPASHVH
jgi:hypothetical protein